MQKANNKRPLKRALKVLGICFAVLLLIVIGLVVWLRTSSGANFVAGQVGSILAGQGLTLTASQFSGPLPSRLLVRDVVVADADGPLFKAAVVEVELAPLALLRGLLHIPLIKIVEPEVIRIPAAGNAQPDEPSGGFSLPMEIRLDELSIAGGRMQEGALTSLGLDTPLLTLAAGGAAQITKAHSSLDFKAEITDDQGLEVLNAVVKLGGGLGNQPDNLAIDIKVEDRPGGLLSRILENPQWAGLNLNLTGQGSLTDWNGQLSLAAGGLGQVTADLNFAGQSGRLWADLLDQPDWRAAIKAQVAPGSGLPANLVTLLALIGPKIDLNLSGGVKNTELSAVLSAKANGDPPVSLETNLTGTLKQAGGDFHVAAQVLGLLPPDVEPGETVTDPALHLAADLVIDRNERRLNNLTVSGTGLSFIANLRQQVDSSAIQGNLVLDVADNTPWVGAGFKLATLEPDFFSGGFNVTGDLDWRGSTEPVSGNFMVKGQNLSWPTETLTNIFGSSLAVEAHLSGGGGGRPVVADIKEAGAGQINLSGLVSFQQTEPLAHSEFHIDLKAALADLSALAADLSGPLTFTIQGDGQLDDLKAKVMLASSEVVTKQGAIADPALDLTIAGALLTEPDSSSSTQTNLSGRLEAKASESPGGPLTMTADWSFLQNGAASRAVISNLTGNLAGLDLNGTLAAVSKSGQHALTGELKAEVAGWEKLSALTGQPISGSPAKLAVTFEAPDQRQSMKVDLDIPALKIGRGTDQILALNQADLTLMADDLFGQLDLDLALQLGSGLSGPFSWGSGSIKAAARTGAGDFEVSLDRARLAGSGGSAKDGLKAAGRFDLTASAIDLDQLDFLLAGGGVKLTEPINLSSGDSFKISPLSLAFLPKGQLTAEVDLTPGALKVKADIKALPYSILKSFGVDIPDGTLNDFSVDLAQGEAGLSGDFSLSTQVAAKELKNLKPSLKLSGKLSDGPSPALTLDGAINGEPGWKSTGQIKARVPLSPGAAGGFPTLNLVDPISGNFTFTGPIGPVWALAGQPDRSLSGFVEIQVEVGGSISKPQPQGSAYLAGGRFEDSILGLLVNDIILEAHATPQAAVTAIVAAKDGHGGGIALEAKIPDYNKPSLSAKGRLSRFSPLHRDDLALFISGDLGAEGPIDKLAFTSDLTLDRGELDLKIIQAGGSIPTLSISDNRESPFVDRPAGHNLGLNIKVPNQLFIRGYGLDSEWRGTLSVNEHFNRLSLVGSLSPVRGYFEIFSKEFQFTGGDISFNGGTNPSLNLELTNNGPNITAILNIGGNAKRPKLSLESRPPLPQEEVLSQVLFGKNSGSISRFEALQLASALRELTNFGEEGGFNAVGFMRESLGLDVLRFGGTDNDRERRASSLSGGMGQELSGGGASGGSGGSESDQISVEAGKYISDNIYVGVEHSATGGSAVRMEVELRPNLSLEGRTSPESSRVGLGWKKDY